MTPPDPPKRILVMGDSHAQYFANVYPKLASVMVDIVPGATIVGLGKRVSHLHFRNRIETAVQERHHVNVIALKLGQVDVDLGLYYRQVVKGEEINARQFFESLAATYLDLLARLRGKKQVIVCGINLPAIFRQENAVLYTLRVITENISDEAMRESLGGKLRELMPNIQERTSRTVLFNGILRTSCVEAGVPYFDLVKESMDGSTGLLHPQFRSFADSDHHYLRSVATVRLFTKKLIAVAGQAVAGAAG